LSAARYSLAAIAQRDLEEIWLFIARDSERHANAVADAILETCQQAAENPSLGHHRQELRNRSILFLAARKYPKYLVAYLDDTSPLQVLRILHGARNLRRIFAAKDGNRR
jgi:plasmid stabilization system protein ParE